MVQIGVKNDKVKIYIFQIKTTYVMSRRKKISINLDIDFIKTSEQLKNTALEDKDLSYFQLYGGTQNSWDTFVYQMGLAKIHQIFPIFKMLMEVEGELYPIIIELLKKDNDLAPILKKVLQEKK